MTIASLKMMLAAAGTLCAATTLVLAHGDVTPQAMDTEALPALGEEWLTENPYRDPNDPVWETALAIGASGYNQNCARCHGLGAVSGGIAPDLRPLEAEEYGDEWYIERFRNGYTQSGITRMPGYGELLGQEAAWAIRTYVETRADDASMEAHEPALKAIRDKLEEWAKGNGSPDPEAVKTELTEIAKAIATMSGAPVADSVARRAAKQIDGSDEAYAAAAQTLTVGLSAAQ